MPVRKKNKGKKSAFAALVFLCLIILSLLFWLFHYANTPGPQITPAAVVTIPPGASFDNISQLLDDAGLIRADLRFKILARVKGLAGKIHAGEFELPTGELPMDLLELLINARVVQHPVTIAEGLNSNEIANIFSERGWCDRKEFLRLVTDRTFIAELGLGKIASMEGYLYPDTYYLTRIPSFDAKKIIRMMVARFFQVWQQIKTDERRALNRHEIVILASIVEKETGDPNERARIASVFFNRLKKNMRLQSDPTVIYGISQFNGNLTREDLKTATPYNTYVFTGLPVGPICNPGKAALAAVLQPSDEDYLYFVSKNDGTHHFSKTLSEHNRAVYKYQKRKRH